ncbi:MAG: sensor histidine kinase [Solirubrobacterales bacterium]
MPSFTLRVAAAGAAVAISLVTAVGTSTFIALREQILDNVREASRHTAEIEGRQAVTVVKAIVSHQTSTAANPLIANALTDTIGRDAYVVPFLKGVHEINGVPVRVRMTDFKGRVIAGSEASGTDVGEVALRAVEKAELVGSVKSDGPGGRVIYASPIIYANTGTPEGALVYDIDTSALAPDERADGLVKRVDVAIADPGQPVPPVDASAVATFVEQLPAGLRLLVSVHADEAALRQPLERLARTFVLVGVLALLSVVGANLALARAATRRLRRMEEEAGRVVGTGSFSERLAVAEGEDELSRLARSFNNVLDRLEIAHHDIAAQAEERLRDSEARYRLLAEYASDGIARLAADGTIRYVSPAAGRLVGEGVPDLVGRRVVDMVHPDDRAELAARLGQEGMAGVLSFRVSNPQRGWVWVEASAHPVPVGPDGGDLVAIMRDISDRKEVEEALAAKTRDLERSNAELEQFAYVASHDLRAPLRMVSNYLQLIGMRLGDRVDTELAEFLGFAVDGAKRMDQLILDLLEFARVGRNRPPFGSVPLAEVVGEAVLPFLPRPGTPGAAIELQPGLPVVMGDRAELGRLFQNLVGNAVKYVRPGDLPEVRVGWSEGAGEVVVSVSDNGIGIAPEHYDRIFMIFQRLHQRNRYEGTGVGLAICKKIVERHGGRIWVERGEGGGSTFRVSFPSVVGGDALEAHS